MKTVLILAMLLSGCAYNSVTINAQGDVNCDAKVYKPVDISTQGNVPFQGTVSNPTMEDLEKEL